MIKGNFGKIARAGILDEYIASIKEQYYLDLKIIQWTAFLKPLQRQEQTQR